MVQNYSIYCSPSFPHWLHLNIVQCQNQEIVKRFCTMRLVELQYVTYTVLLQLQKFFLSSFVHSDFSWQTCYLHSVVEGAGIQRGCRSHTAATCQGLTAGLVLVPQGTASAIFSAPEMPGPLHLCGQKKSWCMHLSVGRKTLPQDDILGLLCSLGLLLCVCEDLKREKSLSEQ